MENIMSFNPYDLMLQLRENKVLFQYLEVASVMLDKEKGWIINGESEEGTTEIHLQKGGCLRFILPISTPDFVTVDILTRVVASLQSAINGVVVANENLMTIDYFMHIPVSNLEYLDEALEEFLLERSEIRQGFDALSKEYDKMEQMMGALSNLQQKKQEGSSSPTSQGPTPQGPAPTSSSLWNDMENIDTFNDEDDDEEDENPPEPSAP